MYAKHQHESWLHKGLRYADEGLRVFGTAKGLYEAGAAVAGGLRTAYGVAAPVAGALALL